MELTIGVKINISALKDVVAKLNMAIEKSKINPKAGWIELETISDSKMTVKVSNYDYYLEAVVPIDCEHYTDEDTIHATVTSETFIPLVSKLEDEFVTMREIRNTLVLTTAKSEYTFPIIKEMGKTKSVDVITANTANCIRAEINGEDLVSISDANAKGLIDASIKKAIQQYIYVDNVGALTYTENIYINNYKNPYDTSFKFLLTCTQARLLKVFEGYKDVSVAVCGAEKFDVDMKVKFVAQNEEGGTALTLILSVQSLHMTETFPAIKLRALASAISDTHAVINKKALDKALARLMVFDKKFGESVMNYSKLVFGTDSVKLVSIKNMNYEIVPYISGTNTTEHESLIRFADIVAQLKAITSNEIDISYGDTPAITINSGELKQLIPEIQMTGTV